MQWIQDESNITLGVEVSSNLNFLKLGPQWLLNITFPPYICQYRGKSEG